MIVWSVRLSTISQSEAASLELKGLFQTTT